LFTPKEDDRPLEEGAAAAAAAVVAAAAEAEQSALLPVLSSKGRGRVRGRFSRSPTSDLIGCVLYTQHKGDARCEESNSLLEGSPRVRRDVWRTHIHSTRALIRRRDMAFFYYWIPATRHGGPVIQGYTWSFHIWRRDMAPLTDATWLARSMIHTMRVIFYKLQQKYTCTIRSSLFSNV